MKRKSPARSYLCSDAKLLQEANLNLHLLTNHLADFAAEDATLDEDYLTQYAAAIEAAQATPSDEVVKATSAALRSEVTKARKLVAKLMRQVRYHVLEAFGDDTDMHYGFGLTEWKTARRGLANTLQFLRILHSTALDHAEELEAAGFGPERIAGIEAAAQALDDAASAHQQYHSSRLTLTTARITTFNAVHSRIARVNALAQIVYADDYELRTQFVFDPGQKQRARKKKAVLISPQ